MLTNVYELCNDYFIIRDALKAWNYSQDESKAYWKTNGIARQHAFQERAYYKARQAAEKFGTPGVGNGSYADSRLKECQRRVNRMLIKKALAV